MPAFVFNGRHDVLHANPLAEALFVELFSDPTRPPNSARYIFLDPGAKAFYAEWDSVAHDVVAALRLAGARLTQSPGFPASAGPAYRPSIA